MPLMQSEFAGRFPGSTFTPVANRLGSFAPASSIDHSDQVDGSSAHTVDGRPLSGSGMVDYGSNGDLQELNQLAQQLAAEKQWDFNQNSANFAMGFEAWQADLDRQFQQASAERAMEFESAEAQKERDYYERLSNTSYQRAVADLKEAGLNPALAYQLGGAASSAGASASGHAAGGSTARGYAASGNKADVDSTTSKDLMTSFVNTGADFFKTLNQTAVGILNAIGEIIPG